MARGPQGYSQWFHETGAVVQRLPRADGPRALYLWFYFGRWVLQIYHIQRFDQPVPDLAPQTRCLYIDVWGCEFRHVHDSDGVHFLQNRSHRRRNRYHQVFEVGRRNTRHFRGCGRNSATGILCGTRLEERVLGGYVP